MSERGSPAQVEGLIDRVDGAIMKEEPYRPEVPQKLKALQGAVINVEAHGPSAGREVWVSISRYGDRRI